jgi:hypothetical protein
VNAETSEASTIHSFIAAAQRRLWAAEAVRHGYSLLWQAGVLLLILAGIHLLSASLPASAPIIGVALLALLTLIRIVLHRPAASESAARADEEFDGKALMATALECLQRPVNAEDLVLRQAREAAVQWRPKVSKLFRTPKSGTGVLAMIPVFIAIMLLSLPGADVDRDLPEDMKQPTMSGPGDQDEDIVADAGGIAAIRRALTDDKAPEGRRAVEEQREGNSETLVPYQGKEANIRSAQLIDLGRIPTEQGAASASGNSEDLPGDALPGSRTLTGDATSTAQFRGREVVELQRTGDVVAAGESQRKTFQETGTRIPTSQIEVLPVAAPATRWHRSMLSPAQSAYASRYLAEIGEANE